MASGKKIIGFVAATGLAVLVLFAVPWRLCAFGSTPWFRGDAHTLQRLANGVERLTLTEGIARENFKTGSRQFDGEWLFGSYLMAGIGFCQLAMERPELAPEQGTRAKRCIDALLSPAVRAFDKEVWSEDPLEHLDGPNAHAAYLGYFNVLLGLYRIAFDDSAYNELNDRITRKLIRHIAESDIGLVQSYPYQVYPVDNCFVIAGVGLHQRATGMNSQAVIDEWVERVRKRYVDADTGLLIQAVDLRDGSAIDDPRGSGTALGLFALHYADPKLANEFYAALKAKLAGSWLGFGTVREYPLGNDGRGDIDSGPIVFGYGLSATGFSLAGARRFQDAAFFNRLYASARLAGAPLYRKDRIEFVSGGPLGNAILFAMFTTPREKP